MHLLSKYENITNNNLLYFVKICRNESDFGSTNIIDYDYSISTLTYKKNMETFIMNIHLLYFKENGKIIILVNLFLMLASRRPSPDVSTVRAIVLKPALFSSSYKKKKKI